MLNQKDKNKNQQNNTNTNTNDKDIDDFKKDVRERMEIINKKITNLQSDSDNHEQDIN